MLLGYSVGPGDPVEIPLAHMAVTGQTQASGKTTTLEALVGRAHLQALAFVTKRGEKAFGQGRRIQPYFRDRADWQFVTSILDATLQEKNKFLRPWIMRICRTTKTLAEVQRAVRDALKTAKGINEGVYTQLDAYLELIVPEIARARLAKELDLVDGLNVMDVSGFATPMQMLFVQSAIDWVNEHEKHTVVVVPEAWEFVPEGRGSPVKASAIALVRKGAALGNFLWVDSQDMAGVDKTILRGCAVWLIGVQREANEIKRNLANIPASIRRPSAADVAMLERGQFFACWGRHCVRTYVRPYWVSDNAAREVARGERAGLASRPAPEPKRRTEVDETEARELREENAELKRQVERLTAQLEALTGKDKTAPPAPGPTAPPPVTVGETFDNERLYQAIKARLCQEAPGIIRLLTVKHEINVLLEQRTIQADGSSVKGRIARLLHGGFYDGGKTNSATRSELKRTGGDVNNANIGRVLDELVSWGFLTLESGAAYTAVQGMKVSISEAP